MRCLFAGTPSAAVPVLESLLASDHEVVGVITRPDAPVGRGRKLAPSPVAVVAEAAGIPIIKTKTLKSEDVIEQIKSLQPDVCPIVAYGGLVPEPLLDLGRFGWLNLHFSLLPAYRGAAPVQRAIAAGETETGISIFRLEAGMDTGPVVWQESVPLTEADTATKLLADLAELGAGRMIEVLDKLAANPDLPFTPQPTEGVSLADKITVEDAFIDFADSARMVVRRANSVTEDPGAWTWWRDQRIKLAELVACTREEANAFGPDLPQQVLPGTIFGRKRTLLVACGSDFVQVGKVSVPGKGWRSGADWARGARLETDERMGQEL
ncbi:methionyl-tRNA formyltransferase [Boudabousia tangfeifanii]|uniref:Methionyl-tRNA formyltransferase n=2 Tax=Boudabousia tangfeifanii TaxID=1912795 RepID=A0A1D9MME8_9ACTO|nr:methionyl-tRNA formyltransferase [Boudabousia tangfeifanii]